MSDETRAAITAAIANVTPETSTAESGIESPEAMPVAAAEESVAEEEAVAEPAAADPAKPAEPAAPVEEDDDFGKVAEFEQLKDGRQRVNRIPHPRVKKMIERSVKAAETALREALGKEHGEKLTAHEKQIAQYEAIGEIMGTNPDRFMEMLASSNPAYKAYAKQDPNAKPVATDDPEPQPDGKMPDGTPGYTEAQWAKREEWKERQIEARAVAKAQAEFKKQYGWLDKERETKQVLESQGTALKSQIADAMTWPGFEANYNDIVTALRVDTEESQKSGKSPKLSIHDAYRTVILKKHEEALAGKDKEIAGLKTDRNKMREEILAELKAAPKGTATIATQPVAAKDTAATAAADGDSPTKAIIRAAAKRIAGRAA